MRIKLEVRTREHGVDKPGHGQQRSGRQAGPVCQELEHHDDRDRGENECQWLQHRTWLTE